MGRPLFMPNKDMLDICPGEFVKNVNDDAARETEDGVNTFLLEDGHNDLRSCQCFQCLSSSKPIVDWSDGALQ
jgi:hypothetical protein